MTERRLGLGGAERAHACWAATRRLGELPELVAAIEAGRVVAGFVSTRAELDPAPALAEARARGARVAYPRIGEAGTRPRPRLSFHLTAPHELVAGRFGLLEPRAGCPEVAPAEIGCVLAPGLAFDGAGHRLGFGGGYYDEWLGALGPAPPQLTVVGLCYDFQIVDDCPAGPEDAGVDRVVSDLRTMTCTRPPTALAGPVGAPRPEGS
jgi:5-formyltetrahydrofolate cyclo-ligase